MVNNDEDGYYNSEFDKRKIEFEKQVRMEERKNLMQTDIERFKRKRAAKVI